MLQFIFTSKSLLKTTFYLPLIDKDSQPLTGNTDSPVGKKYGDFTHSTKEPKPAYQVKVSTDGKMEITLEYAHISTSEFKQRSTPTKVNNAPLLEMHRKLNTGEWFTKVHS